MRTSNGGLRTIILIVVALVALVVLWSVVSYYWTNYLWYQEMGHTNVFWTPFLGRLCVGLFFAVIFFALFYRASALARKLSPRFKPVEGGPDGNVLEMITRHRWSDRAILAVSLVISLIVGISYGGRWREVLLFLNRQEFGYADPLFGKDASFFVYTLPLWNMLVNFVGITMFLTLVFTRRRILGRPRRLALFTQSPGARAACEGASLGDLGRVSCWPKPPTTPCRDGSWSTRREASCSAPTTPTCTWLLPVLYVLAIVSLVAAVLFVVNVFFRGWKIPAIAIGLMLVFWFVGGKIVPYAVQSLQVKPNEIAKDSEYIADNIDVHPLGLRSGRASSAPLWRPTSDLTAAEVAANAATIRQCPHMGTRGRRIAAFSQLQALKPYYTFNDVDVDRYILDGELRQVLISARELDQTNLQTRTWVNERLSYTHGYGFVLSPVNEAASAGSPVFLVKDIPPLLTFAGLEDRSGPRLYYGELGNSFVIVGTDTQEFDYPEGDSDVYTTYEGERRHTHRGLLSDRPLSPSALGSLSIFTSGSLEPESRIMFRRTLQERVQALAPFLVYDYDPYLVVRDDGSLVWMWDAYTTTRLFPYSQPWSSAGASTARYISLRHELRPQLGEGGHRRLQRRHDLLPGRSDDSIVNTWGKVYEGLFTPADQMPADLRAHMRYPENLYSVQADMLTTYHMTDPPIFYSQQDAWEIPTEIYDEPEQLTSPYYQVLALPGETEAESALLLPFAPANKANMVALLAARQDGEHYGELLLVDFPKGKLTDGPALIEAKISNDPNDLAADHVVGPGGQQRDTRQSAGDPHRSVGGVLRAPVPAGHLSRTPYPS